MHVASAVWLLPTLLTAGLAQGPMVNAPVAPEAIYVGQAGASAGVAVIDCNGFGQGTGDINNTRFPFNPNIGQVGVFPPLAPGVSNLDAGSGGALTLVRDSWLNTNLLPSVTGVSDIAIGMPLDIVFHNVAINRNAATTNQVNPVTGMPAGIGNTIAVAPHPNPPRLVFPSPNPSRGIDAEEPTTTSSVGPPGRVTTTSPPCIQSPMNLLVPGNPFATTPSAIGLFGANFSGVFYGPQPLPPLPPPPTPFCPFTSRQQIGHFLFVADRLSNRDDIVNNGALPDVPPAGGWIPPATHSGKGHAKTFGGVLLPAHQPGLLFVACVDTGTVDVFSVASGQRLVTIAVPGVSVVANYWRQ